MVTTMIADECPVIHFPGNASRGIQLLVMV